MSWLERLSTLKAAIDSQSTDQILAAEAKLHTYFMVEGIWEDNHFFHQSPDGETLIIDDLYALYHGVAEAPFMPNSIINQIVHRLHAEKENVTPVLDRMQAWLSRLAEAGSHFHIEPKVSIQLNSRTHCILLAITTSHDESAEAMLVWKAITEQIGCATGIKPHGFFDQMAPRTTTTHGKVLLQMRYRLDELQSLDPAAEFSESDVWRLFKAGGRYESLFNLAVIQPQAPDETYHRAYKTAVERQSEPAHLAWPVKVILTVSTGPALGNLSLVVRVANRLAEQFGHEVVLFVGMSGHTDPGYTLHDKVLFYKSPHELMELYPLIRFHTQAPNAIVISFNGFFDQESQCWQLPAVTNSHTPMIDVFEYHYANFRWLLGDAVIKTGLVLQEDDDAWGIIHPSQQTEDTRIKVYEKLRSLNDEKVNSMLDYGGDPDMVTYFGYLYNPKSPEETSEIKGLDVRRVLVTFLGHIAASKQQQAKIYLPIQHQQLVDLLSTDEGACLIRHYSFHYHSDEVDSVHGQGDIYVWIYHGFPMPHVAFRLMMQDAMLCETPVAVTGDQSLIETFFGRPNFILLYQVLDHKLPLFEALLALCDRDSLDLLKSHLQSLVKHSSDDERISTWLADGELLFNNKVPYHKEMNVLRDRVRSQPELVDGIQDMVCLLASTRAELVALGAIIAESAHSTAVSSVWGTGLFGLPAQPGIGEDAEAVYKLSIDLST